jgi:hypothetical protein
MLGACALRNPWVDSSAYQPDYVLLERLLSLSVRQGAGQPSGRLARATDAWVGQELRCAGFGENEVWPRRVQPRVLPQSLIDVEAIARETGAPSIRRAIKGWSQARLLGQYYLKQVDVLIADWDRGAELIVSTKSMLSSYWNNLRNRFEEFVGDAKNLRGRYPLAAIGILFVVRSTISEEQGALQFLADMLTRLRNPELFDTAGLVVARWSDSDAGSWQGEIDLGEYRQLQERAEEQPVVTVLLNGVPDAVHPSRFCRELVDCVLSRTPVTFHKKSRELKSGQVVPVPEESRRGDPDE